jgi:predicted RNA-binding protein with PUA-like domain
MSLCWLLKTEPDEFSIQDLAKSPEQSARWDGIRNFQARNFLRDQAKINDTLLIYHAQCKSPGIYGEACLIKGPYADPSQFDPQSPYFDPKATPASPRWYCMDIRLVQCFKQPVLLNTLKQQPQLSGMVLFKQGRLSVQPVEWADYAQIKSLSAS